MFVAEPNSSPASTVRDSNIQLQQRSLDTDIQSLFTAILNQSDIQGFRSLENDQQTDVYRQQLSADSANELTASDSNQSTSDVKLPNPQILGASDSVTPSEQSQNGQPDSITSVSDEISKLWQQWVSTAGAPRYQEVRNAVQHTENFGQVLIRAKDQQAYVAPQAFLSQLSKEDLQAVQKVHGLAEPIQIDSLTYEGALNLLLPPSAQVDFDHNGLTQSGAANTLRFPDSQTSPQMVNAWEQATADLPESEKMLRVLQMKVGVLLSNLHRDPRSGKVTQIEPGDPRFTNPYADPDFSYQHEVSQRLESLEYFKDQTPADQYQRDKTFWTGFLEALRQQDVD